MNPLRVLVVDDAAVCRKIVRDFLAGVPGLEVVGTASNGQSALEAIEGLRPDLITLDLEMPVLDGLGVLAELRRRRSPTAAIVLSGVTEQSAQLTIKALQAGAFDFVRKPTTTGIEESVLALRGELLPKIEAYRRSRRNALASPGTPAPVIEKRSSPQRHEPAEVIVIGVSTGGPVALAALLPRLPADLPVPILIVQHMPPLFTKSMAADLDRICRLRVSEAVQGEPVLAQHVYLAPGGKQMRLCRQGPLVQIEINDDPPEKSCRPSVDYLFRSAVQVYGHRTLGVVLTGMGDDGLLGCTAIREAQGQVVAQHEASCVVYGMPRAVVEARLADAVLPLNSIPAELMQRSGMGVLACR